MTRRVDDALTDMLVAAEDAASIIERGRDAFDRDRLLQRAAKNLLAEVGEAAKAITDKVAAGMPGVPWRAVKGMREKVVHDYPEIDLDIVWATLAQDMPELARQIRAYRESE